MEAYTAYTCGIQKSLALLQKLNKKRKFSQFIQSPRGIEEAVDFCLEAFIKHPAQHYQKLCSYLRDLIEADEASFQSGKNMLIVNYDTLFYDYIFVTSHK